MDTECTDQDLFERIGERIAQDLREQAERRPRDAAAAAGCGTEAEAASWLVRHRPDARQQPNAAA